MKSQLVDFQNKPRIAGVIDLCEAKPSRASFLTTVAFSKRVRQIPAENKRTQLCLHTELAKE